jgi:hypothetical protein
MSRISGSGHIGPIDPFPGGPRATAVVKKELEAARKQLEVTGERSGVGSDAYKQLEKRVHRLSTELGFAGLRDAYNASHQQRKPSQAEQGAAHAGGGGGGPVLHS